MMTINNPVSYVNQAHAFVSSAATQAKENLSGTYDAAVETIGHVYNNVKNNLPTELPSFSAPSLATLSDYSGDALAGVVGAASLYFYRNSNALLKRTIEVAPGKPTNEEASLYQKRASKALAVTALAIAAYTHLAQLEGGARFVASKISSAIGA